MGPFLLSWLGVRYKVNQYDSQPVDGNAPAVPIMSSTKSAALGLEDGDGEDYAVQRTMRFFVRAAKPQQHNNERE